MKKKTEILISIGAGTYFSKKMNILKLDLNKNSIKSFISCDHKIYPKSTKGFTGIYKNSSKKKIYAVNETEIFFISNKVIRRKSFKFFNDLHYIFFDKDQRQFLIVNTGIDAIEIFDSNLKHLKSISLVKKRDLFISLKTDIKMILSRVKNVFIPSISHKLYFDDIRYKNLDKEISFSNLKKVFFSNHFYKIFMDMRYVFLRPHLYHPNYIEKIKNNFLITLKRTGEVIDLMSKEVIISGLSSPHDGILRNNVYLVTEAGRGVLKFAKNIKTVNDLKFAKFKNIKICKPNEGFLRGVDMISSNMAIVAISKRREIDDKSKAWVALVDLNNYKILKKIFIPLKFGTNPFSVVAI